ncbi:SPFH domain-containing protein [Brucepastera parasyntrophica]|uniref:SPFH domain-containing protein n=1 Tax=Brucepastera parasyntrophica TaxID=2880008 RepID=UPI003F71AC06
MPGEEAIFIKGGNIEQTFDNGTYKLSTENYPFISRLRNAFTGGISTFNAVVYFVRKAHSMEILWGTTSPIQVRDKLLGIATELRGRGAYKIQIENPSIFLTKLLGSGIPFEGQKELINEYFINEFQSKIKETITQCLNETQTELLGIESKIGELSKLISPSIDAMLNDYGIRLQTFSIAALTISDDQLRRKYDEIGMDAIAKLRMAQADKGVMDVLGDDWGKQQAADILSKVAENPGAGGMASAGAGIGMGLAAGGELAGMAQQMFNPVNNNKQSESANDPVAALKNLKKCLTWA